MNIFLVVQAMDLSSEWYQDWVKINWIRNKMKKKIEVVFYAVHFEWK